MIKVVCGIRGCWPTIATIVTTTETATVETAAAEVNKNVIQWSTLFENIPFMGIVIAVSLVLLLIYVITLWKIYSKLSKTHQEEP